MENNILLAIFVLLAASVIAFLLSSTLRALIENPISQLVKATTAVSETGDYAIRAKKVSGDELGLLADGFNEMLAQIQQRAVTLPGGESRVVGFYLLKR